MTSTLTTRDVMSFVECVAIMQEVLMRDSRQSPTNDSISKGKLRSNESCPIDVHRLNSACPKFSLCTVQVLAIRPFTQIAKVRRSSSHSVSISVSVLYAVHENRVARVG